MAIAVKQQYVPLSDVCITYLSDGYALLSFLWRLIVSLDWWHSPSLEETPERSTFPHSPGEVVGRR